jgi:hypothetical protein
MFFIVIHASSGRSSIDRLASSFEHPAKTLKQNMVGSLQPAHHDRRPILESLFLLFELYFESKGSSLLICCRRSLFSRSSRIRIHLLLTSSASFARPDIFLRKTDAGGCETRLPFPRHEA